MRAFLLGAIGALSLLTTTPNAQAGTWEQWFRWAGASLNRSGISVDINSPCDPRAASYYIPSRRTILLCHGALSNGPAFMAEAIAHEAVHAAQHCLGLAHNRDTLMPISTFLAARGYTHFAGITRQTLYSRASSVSGSMRIGNGSALIEAEAYAMEKHPTQAIELLEASCN